MAKTRADLVADVLDDLNEAGVGQPISDEDSTKITNSLDAIFANLLGRNVVLQPIGDEIADELFDPLCAVVVGRHARAFGLGSDDRIKAEADMGEKQLRTLSRINRGSRNTLQVDTALRPRRWWGGFSRYPL
jgi:hypothetical protein